MLNILFVILKKKKYAVIAILTAVLMGAISYWLTVINVFHKNLIIYAEMNGIWFTIISLTLSGIIAIMFGAYMAMLFLKRDIGKTKAKANKVASSAGGITGIVAAGCPSCGTPLLGLVGLPLGLFSLPLKGIELKILSIGLLFWSISLISNNIKKNLACEKK